MSASVTNDKITAVRDTANPTVTTVSTARSIGGTSLACASLSHWPTDTAVHFITYQKDPTTGLIDRTTQCDWKGTVSSNTISNLTLENGTDAGNAVGDFVEMAPTAAYGQDLYDALTTEHNTDGTHSDITPTSVTTGALTATGAVDLSGASSVNLPASSVTAANLGDSGLVQLTYASGYSSSGAYARKVGCVIYLQGFIKINSGTIPSSATTVATLPAGMIDGIYRELPINYTSKATISSTGQLMLADKDAVQFIYVDGISFITT